jgi:tetratricopeptide (TPR) repeat protein
MAALQHIDTLLKARQFEEAAQAASLLTREHPENAEGWHRLGYVQEVTGDIPGALQSYKTLVEKRPDEVRFSLKLAQTYIQAGEHKAAIQLLDHVRAEAPNTADTLQQLGQIYTALGLFQKAYECYQAAVKALDGHAGVDVASALYNLASAATAVGKLEEAEALFEKAIALNPADYDAYYNRSTLRKQTAEHNHIADMEGLLKAGIPDRKGAVQLFYALAKEYEDLGEAGASFAHLQRGANLRASMMSYRVETDVAAMEQIKTVFDEKFCAGIQAGDGEGPIFILGLPRTGTTLVDRILSSHSAVESLGEINDFALSLTRAVGPAADKAAFIRRAAELDFTEIGLDYLRSTRERGVSAPCLVDKTPANFLYLGLIAKALPAAKIIHLRRHPMDSCYAIYKTLFRMGYPYSYRLADLGHYYAAYHQLMDHWRRVLPGRFVDLDYEALVQNQESETRALLDAVGLSFEKACLAFHRNSTPSATASAAQVKQPIHTKSIGKWQDYRTQLKPLSDMLSARGIRLDNEQVS